MKKQLALGADIGGTHITAALVDPVTKQVIMESISRTSTNALSGNEELLAAWSACISRSVGKEDVSAVCLAMPGPFDYDAGICLIRDQNKFPGLYGKNIKTALASHLDISSEKIFMDNDAACFLLGELFNDSLSGFGNVIGVTLGTGLGTAVFSEQQAKSADLWNMPFRDSIAEDYLSSKWFIDTYHERTGRHVGSVKKLSDLFEDDVLVAEIFEEFGDNLGNFLNLFIQRHPAEAIVIGGNIARSLQLFEKPMRKQLDANHPQIIVHRSVHGENAALLGAVGSRMRAMD